MNWKISFSPEQTEFILKGKNYFMRLLNTTGNDITPFIETLQEIIK